MRPTVRRLLLTFVYVSLLILLSGCSEPGWALDNMFGPRPGRYHIAGRSVMNRPIEYSVHGRGPQTILIIGAIHGSEPASEMLVSELQRYLNSKPSFLNSTRVVVAPVVNPDGLAAGTRHNVNGVDLNRNFPSANRLNCAEFGFEPLSEPESRAIKKLIEEYKPARIVSVHQLLACIDYDGPGKAPAEAMAAVCDLPVRKLGAKPGSLGSYAGVTLGIPTITLELPEGAENIEKEKLWENYKEALLTAVN